MQRGETEGRDQSKGLEGVPREYKKSPRQELICKDQQLLGERVSRRRKRHSDEDGKPHGLCWSPGFLKHLGLEKGKEPHGARGQIPLGTLPPTLATPFPASPFPSFCTNSTV